MIKRIFTILLATIMICSISPMNAFANQTSGSIAVSYTHSLEYSINIPASTLMVMFWPAFPLDGATGIDSGSSPTIPPSS
ncbi:hypothetical protein J2Z80_000692 [Thermoanaerobacterium butyriciformans]|uniref:Uncharacterized protein n=1 Tax=Thermoanaerobacterium butyriciformans TaxID=1702242 RepID=A0ABS4NC05_9THEO|nr:hypothetical protein [Thermoanaerobacterium butyriciformans]